jgi:hypothetical protein
MPKPDLSIDETLNQRGSVYGPYDVGVRVRTEMLEAIKRGYREINQMPMDPEVVSMISDITNKLSRLCGTPSHIDTWHDIEGYAKRIKDVFLSKETPKNGNQ